MPVKNRFYERILQWVFGLILIAALGHIVYKAAIRIALHFFR